MDPITIDATKDLADRVVVLENAVTAIVAAINALPATDTSALSAQIDAFKTELDSFSGRLDGDEKTMLAMGDTIKSLPALDVAEDIVLIKTRVNAFHEEVWGTASPNVPFPVPITAE